MRFLNIVLLLTLTLPLTAADDKREPGPIPVVKLPRTEPVSYEKEVVAILEAKCLVCHAGNVQRGKLDLSSVAGLLKGGTHGPAVVSGKSAESLLVQRAGRTAK